MKMPCNCSEDELIDFLDALQAQEREQRHESDLFGDSIVLCSVEVLSFKIFLLCSLFYFDNDV